MTTCSSDPTAPSDVWRGDPALPTHNRASLFGTPLGCTDFVVCVALVVVLCSIKSQLHSPSCPP